MLEAYIRCLLEDLATNRDCRDFDEGQAIGAANAVIFTLHCMNMEMEPEVSQLRESLKQSGYWETVQDVFNAKVNRT